MITKGSQNIYAAMNVNLERVNPLWGEVEPLPLRETLAEYGHSIPAPDLELDAAHFDPEATAKLMLENDPLQVYHYLRSADVDVGNAPLTKVLDTILELNQERPGFIYEMWNRFNPLVTPQNKNSRATRLIKSFGYWAEDVPHKFLEKTLKLRNEALKRYASTAITGNNIRRVLTYK